MRVALLSFHVCPWTRPGQRDAGGMNIYLRNMAASLAQRGLSVDIYTRWHTAPHDGVGLSTSGAAPTGAALAPAEGPVDHRTVSRVEISPGVRLWHIPVGPKQASKARLAQHTERFARAIIALCEKQGQSYDLVHSHYWLSGAAGLVLGRTWQVPHVATFHTLAEVKLRSRAGEREPPVRASTERQVVASSQAVVASTEHERGVLVQYYQANPGRVHVVPPGVDGVLFQAQDQRAARRTLGLDGQQLVLFVGRPEPLKGTDLLLRAVASMENRQNLKVLVVGGSASGDRQIARMRRLARKLGISQVIDFLGSVPHYQMPHYYSAADVLVMPSYYESFGLAALEAMSCGTPVVAARVGGLSTLVQDGRTGYLVSPQCPEVYAQRLEMLLVNRDLRASFGAAARQRAMGMRWSAVAQNMVSLYQDLIGQGAGDRA